MQGAVSEMEARLTLAGVAREQPGSGKQGRKALFTHRSQGEAEPAPTPGHESRPEAAAKRVEIGGELSVSR